MYRKKNVVVCYNSFNDADELFIKTEKYQKIKIKRHQIKKLVFRQFLFLFLI